MTYNPNIPNPTDILSNSQVDIKSNFNKANSSFGTDHYSFADLTPNNGFHQRATFPGNATPATPAANYGAMYSVTNASNETWPYWRRDGSTTNYPLQATRVFGTFRTNPLTLDLYSFGISSVTLVSTGRYQVNFTVPFPDAGYSVFPSLEFGASPLASAACIVAYGVRLAGSCEIQLWRQDGNGFSTLLPNISVTILRKN